MKVLDPGHVYLVESVGNPAFEQTLVFVKNRGEKYPGNEGEPHSGTIVQDVLRVLIDRTAYLNSQGSCAETEYALGSLRQALGWFEYRAARCREDFIDLPHADSLEKSEKCSVCGHTHCHREVHERLPGTYR